MDGFRNQSLEERASWQHEAMRAMSKEELDAKIQAQLSGMQNEYPLGYVPTNQLLPQPETGAFASLKRYLNSLGARVGLPRIFRARSSSCPSGSTNAEK
jgi:hypothetical protein